MLSYTKDLLGQLEAIRGKGGTQFREHGPANTLVWHLQHPEL
jgi:hypothetical protein